MERIKILHCADLHIGGNLSSMGVKGRRRKTEVLQTFDRIILKCQEDEVQLLLVAGDLFDGFHVKNSDIGHIKDGFASIPDTVVAISPGNHDPLTRESYYLNEEWSPNVTVFNGEIKAVEFPSLQLRLWGGGFTATYQAEPLLEGIQAPTDEFINICVLHGDLVSEHQASNYNPVTTEQIKKSNMDYIALGHIHKRTELRKAGNTFYAYPGSPEGQGFDELGERGVLTGYVGKQEADIGFLPLCKRMHIELRVDISEAISTLEMVDKIIGAMKRRYGSCYADHLYKIILEGSLPPEIQPDIDGMKARIEEMVFYIKIKNKTVLQLDMEELLKEPSLRGIFVRRMSERIRSAAKSGDIKQKEKCEQALILGLKAFDGEVAYRED